MMRIYPDCEVCAGTGSVRVAHQSGFFSYGVGSPCYACQRREQDEIAAQSTPAFASRGDDSIEALKLRISELEQKVAEIDRRTTS